MGQSGSDVAWEVRGEGEARKEKTSLNVQTLHN